MNKKTIVTGIAISATSAFIGVVAKELWDVVKRVRRNGEGSMAETVSPNNEDDPIDSICMYSPTDEAPDGEEPISLTAYLSGYEDGFSDGVLSAQSSALSSECSDYAPTADDDAIPEEMDAAPTDEASDADPSSAGNEWTCLEALANVPITRGKQVAEMIMSCIPFGEDPETSSAPLVNAILRAAFTAVKHQSKDLPERKPGTYATAFELLKSLNDGDESATILSEMAAKPERIEAILKPFVEADMEDQKQALTDICNVLSSLDAEKVVKIVKTQKSEPQP